MLAVIQRHQPASDPSLEAAPCAPETPRSFTSPPGSERRADDETLQSLNYSRVQCFSKTQLLVYWLDYEIFTKLDILVCLVCMTI
jgi:hypothetical protein